MVTRIIVALAATLFGGAVVAHIASAQQVDCAGWAQQLQARGDAFDARCSSHAMTIGGPEYQACQAEQNALRQEMAQWQAACARR